MSTVKVAGIGWAQPEEERVSHAELLYRATRRALDSAGLERDAISSAVTTSYDYVEGRNLSNQFTLDSIGGTMKSCDLRLSDDGIHSIAAGCVEALSEPGAVVVVGAVQMGGTELIDSTERSVEETFYEPLYMRPVIGGSAHPEALAFGLAARAYLSRHGVDEALLDELVATRSAAGEEPRSAEQIAASPVIAGPLRDGHRARGPERQPRQHPRGRLVRRGRPVRQPRPLRAAPDRARRQAGLRGRRGLRPRRRAGQGRGLQRLRDRRGDGGRGARPGRARRRLRRPAGR
jgi:hypothetical protein